MVNASATADAGSSTHEGSTSDTVQWRKPRKLWTTVHNMRGVWNFWLFAWNKTLVHLSCRVQSRCLNMIWNVCSTDSQWFTVQCIHTKSQGEVRRVSVRTLCLYVCLCVSRLMRALNLTCVSWIHKYEQLFVAYFVCAAGARPDPVSKTSHSAHTFPNKPLLSRSYSANLTMSCFPISSTLWGWSGP